VVEAEFEHAPRGGGGGRGRIGRLPVGEGGRWPRSTSRARTGAHTNRQRHPGGGDRVAWASTLGALGLTQAPQLVTQGPAWGGTAGLESLDQGPGGRGPLPPNQERPNTPTLPSAAMPGVCGLAVVGGLIGDR